MFGDVSWQTLVVSVIAGVGTGSVVALVSLSLALVYSTTGYFSFAVGPLISGGALASRVLFTNQEWPLAPTVLAVTAFGFAVGLLSHLLCVRPIRSVRHNREIRVLFTTIGFGLAMQSLLQIKFGSEHQPVKNFVSSDPLFIGTLSIRPVYLVLVATALIFGLSFEFFLRGTQIGLSMRAVQQDSEGARLFGVDTRRVEFWIFGSSGAIAALSGFLVAPVLSASPYVGEGPFLLAFAAVAVGGFSSFAGALLSGVSIGIVSSVVPLFAEPAAATPAVLLIVLFVLLIKPHGIFQRGRGRIV